MWSLLRKFSGLFLLGLVPASFCSGDLTWSHWQPVNEEPPYRKHLPGVDEILIGEITELLRGKGGWWEEGWWYLISAPGPSPNQMWRTEGAGLGGLILQMEGDWMFPEIHVPNEHWSLGRVCNLESQGLPPSYFFPIGQCVSASAPPP